MVKEVSDHEHCKTGGYETRCQRCSRALEGHGNIQHRLVDMGVVKGSHITVVKVAPLGDPVEVKVKGTALALRKNEAAMISVAVGGGH